MFFQENFFTFFQELEKNNCKEWFDIHRGEYEQFVKNPFKSFVTHLIQNMKSDYPYILQEPAKCIFRINKDIRFSKDKSPYKNNVAAVFSRSGTKDLLPGFYVHIGAKEMIFGGGMYQMDKIHLAKVRQEIFYNEKEFKQIISQKAFKNTFGEIMGEENKVLPEEYKIFAKTQPLIAKKQFYYSAKLTKSDILAPDFDKKLLAGFKAGAPLNDFLFKALAG